MPMANSLSKLHQSTFCRLLISDSTAHFTKRLAYLDEDGHPPSWALNDPRHKYVLEACNRQTRVERALTQAAGLIVQIEHPPPEAWLDTVGLAVEAYSQQIIDHFTLVLYSTLDRTLLLANFVLSLGIYDHLATYKAVSKELRIRAADVADKFSSLYEATAPLSDPRHFFAHRGESRRINVFSEVARTKRIVKIFGVPTDGVVFSDTQARSELLRTMENDLSSVCSSAVDAMDALALRYETEVQLLGGIDFPTEQEHARAMQAVRYFEGGEVPAFMNEGN
jgi:hypothetical protein